MIVVGGGAIEPAFKVIAGVLRRPGPGPAAAALISRAAISRLPFRAEVSLLTGMALSSSRKPGATTYQRTSFMSTAAGVAEVIRGRRPGGWGTGCG